MVGISRMVSCGICVNTTDKLNLTRLIGDIHGLHVNVRGGEIESDFYCVSFAIY